jgi:tight adherence protein C
MNRQFGEPVSNEVASRRRLFAPIAARFAADSTDSRPDLETDDLVEPTDVGAVAGPFGRFTPILAACLPDSVKSRHRIRAALRRSGDYRLNAYQDLAAVRYVGLMSAIIVFGTLSVIVPQPWETWCIFGLAAGMLAAWFLPMVNVRERAACRVRDIARGIPDLSEMIDLCAAFGLSLPETLAFASRELQAAHPALAEELAIVCRQEKLGNLADALDNFASRIDVAEVRSLRSRLLT